MLTCVTCPLGPIVARRGARILIHDFWHTLSTPAHAKHGKRSSPSHIELAFGLPSIRNQASPGMHCQGMH